MEISKALTQISEIHERLAKSEIYRDYRSGPVALSGALALAAAGLQTRLIGHASGLSYVYYWTAAGSVCALTAGLGVIRGYLAQSSPALRRRTRIVLGQLLPCLAGGALVTVALGMIGATAIRLLPGIWAILFSQGVFASRPYLPRIMGYVALYYLAAGGALLSPAGLSWGFSPWTMGLTFGIGQMLAGLVLYWNLERKS